MEIKEIKKNIFDIDYNKYHFAHCISLDCEMGQGVAVGFCNREQKMREALLNVIFDNEVNCPFTILYRGDNMNIFNLITKKSFNLKPTYSSIYECIKQMKSICINSNITHLAMPKIGCGKDRLDWNEVKEMLEIEFKNIDIEILICF